MKCGKPAALREGAAPVPLPARAASAGEAARDGCGGCTVTLGAAAPAPVLFPGTAEVVGKAAGVNCAAVRELLEVLGAAAPVSFAGTAESVGEAAAMDCRNFAAAPGLPVVLGGAALV